MKKLLLLVFVLSLCMNIFAACDTGVGSNYPMPDTEKNTEGGNESESCKENVPERENELVFTSNGDGTCTLTGVVYAFGEVLIPEISPDGNLVTHIGEEAFMNCPEITSVVIPNSVIFVGKSAFKSCTGIKKVSIGNSVKQFGSDAFDICDSIEEVHISDLAAWCNTEFSNINSSPLAYGRNIFVNGELVTDLVIPDGVTTVKAYAFEYCIDIKSVTIPDSVTSLEYGAFSCCIGIERVEMSSSVEQIDSYAFYNCLSLKRAPDLSHVKSIGSYAFAECESLEEVTIPSGVDKIGEYAFAKCQGLKSLIIQGDSRKISKSVFSESGNIENATVPLECLNYVNFRNLILLSVNGDGDLPDEACSFYTRLKSVVISEGIDSVGDKAFRGCTSLEELTIPKSVKKIGEAAFEYCIELKTVNFAGTEAEWKTIEGIDRIPKNVTVNFNYTIGQ